MTKSSKNKKITTQSASQLEITHHLKTIIIRMNNFNTTSFSRIIMEKMIIINILETMCRIANQIINLASLKIIHEGLKINTNNSKIEMNTVITLLL